MAIPNVVHPWSHNAASWSPEVAPEPIDLSPVAAALFSAGFKSAAITLAELGSDEGLRECARQWRLTDDTDAALAAMIGRVGESLVPSVSLRDDGAPRFVLHVPDPNVAAAAIRQEHGANGVDAELRLFLDEALRSGDRFVDAEPGMGFAILSAATAPADVSVIALHDDAEQRAALETSARLSDVEATVSVHDSIALDALPSHEGAEGRATILHAGSAAVVAPLMCNALAALERREIGAVAWRCGVAGDTGRDAEGLQVAAAVLSVLGFLHFALADAGNGTELVPADAMASNEMIFSLHPEFLARFAA